MKADPEASLLVASIERFDGTQSPKMRQLVGI